MEGKSSEIPDNIDEIFAAAVDIVQNLPKEGPLSVPNKEKLKFYSLYKQATEGPCNIPRPPFWQPIERFKWDGWNSLREMDAKLAKHIYVRKMQKMIDQVYQTHDISQLFGYVGDNGKELDAKMRPKFKLIGRELLTPEQTNAALNPEQNSEGFTEVANIFLSKKIDDTVSSISDDEYADAWEAPAPPVPTTTLLEKQPDSRPHYSCTLDFQVQVLSDQVKQLSQSLMEQSKLLNQFMREIITLQRQQRFGGLSWSMFALIILWPFFAKYVFKYLVRVFLNFVQ